MKKVEVQISFSTNLTSKGAKKHQRILVSSLLEDALNEIKNLIGEKGTRASYLIYYKGTFITGSSIRGSGRKVHEGDVFKLVPIMCGG